MEIINRKAFIKTFFIGLLIVLVAALIGAGIYINFIKKDDNTGSNANKNTNNNVNGIPTELVNTEYKTFDSKYNIKITESGKIYLDGKEVKEQRDRILGNNYMQIFVDFIPSSGYITDMTFILDGVNKVIMEKPDYEVGQEDKDAFGEYGKFSSRTGIKLIKAGNSDFIGFESEGPTELYTTTWKKIGWLVEESVKYDDLGIYACDNFDDNFNCIKESKYDAEGNKVN